MTPTAIVHEMMSHDQFSHWLGAEVMRIELGLCDLLMTVRPEMCNGMRIAHGGVSFSLADSAFAFACNSHGRLAVSIESSISHFKAIQVGDILRAQARQIHRSHKTGKYEVHVYNQEEDLVALFLGTCYVRSAEW